MKIDTKEFKIKLEEEQATLLSEMANLGAIRNPQTNDWDARPEAGAPQADENDLADRAEDYEARTALVNTLELRLKDIELALAKIETGTYGICEISGEPIELERLRANPAARTNMQNINKTP